jgi:hypothetical protein
MTKVVAPLVAIMIALMFTAVSGGTAMAQYSRGRMYCPPGTCGNDGRTLVKDIKFCKKENCKKKK